MLPTGKAKLNQEPVKKIYFSIPGKPLLKDQDKTSLGSVFQPRSEFDSTAAQMGKSMLFTQLQSGFDNETSTFTDLKQICILLIGFYLGMLSMKVCQGLRTIRRHFSNYYYY